MRILTFTTLYPNHVRPQQGIFVENRVRRLVETGAVTTRVVAPVPWFPLKSQYFGRYADFAKVGPREQRFGIDVLHPSYPVIPKMGMTLAPGLMYAAVAPAVHKVLRSGFEFDLIDAHYFYPDGVAAAMLARKLGKPLVITARGSDINIIPRFRWARKMILWAAANATLTIAVCDALKGEMGKLGMDPAKIRVLRNGVDLSAFKPVDREAAKARLGVTSPVLLMVGNLVALKGHEIAIRALAELPNATLLIVGWGPMETALKSLVASLGLENRVHFLGAVGHAHLAEIYGAAEVLLQPSESEGLPNVVLEAMACGLPVIASAAGGSSEVMTVGKTGLILPERTPQALASAVRALLARPHDRVEIRHLAEQFGWEATTSAQLELFDELIESRRQCRKPLQFGRAGADSIN